MNSAASDWSCRRFPVGSPAALPLTDAYEGCGSHTASVCGEIPPKTHTRARTSTDVSGLQMGEVPTFCEPAPPVSMTETPQPTNCCCSVKVEEHEVVRTSSLRCPFGPAAPDLLCTHHPLHSL